MKVGRNGRSEALLGPERRCAAHTPAFASRQRCYSQCKHWVSVPAGRQGHSWAHCGGKSSTSLGCCALCPIGNPWLLYATCRARRDARRRCRPPLAQRRRPPRPFVARLLPIADPPPGCVPDCVCAIHMQIRTQPGLVCTSGLGVVIPASGCTRHQAPRCAGRLAGRP